MNRLEYYNRQKEKWEDAELQEVKTEYESKEMTISQIADIHKRTPGSISYKLKNLGIITQTTMCRGYFEYKNSNLYREIIETAKITDAEKKTRKEARLKIRLESMKFNTTNEIDNIDSKVKQHVVRSSPLYIITVNELKTEIADLKKDVKELLRIMNSFL